MGGGVSFFASWELIVGNKTAGILGKEFNSGGWEEEALPRVF